MNVIGNALRKQLSAFDSKGAADEKFENKVVENQRFNPATERWSFKNLTQDDPKRFSSEIGDTDQFPTIPLPAGFEYSGLWEIDYNYHDELSGQQNTSTPTPTATKPRAGSDARDRTDAPGDLDPDESGEWVYSASFEALARGEVMECAGSSTTTPALSPIREEEQDRDENRDSEIAGSPPSDNSLADSLRAALEAEYDLPADATRAPVEAVALVRQRRYKRQIVRTRKPGEPAAAMLQAKGAAVVGSAGKMLSTTNKFLTDVAESNKKDIAKLVNVAKDKMSSKSNGGMGGSVHGDSAGSSGNCVSASPLPGFENEVEEGSAEANTAANSVTSNTPVLSPSPVPCSTSGSGNSSNSNNNSNSNNISSASGGVSGVKSPPARVQSFTSRMFGFSSSSNANTPTNTTTTNTTANTTTTNISTNNTNNTNNSSTPPRPLPITPPNTSPDKNDITRDLASSHISTPTDSSVSPTINSTNTTNNSTNNSATNSASSSVHTSPRGKNITPTNSKQDLSRRNTTDTNVSSDSNTDSTHNANLINTTNTSTTNTTNTNTTNTNTINNPLPSTTANDTFDMEIDMDGADFENNSEIGDNFSDTMSVSGAATTDYNPHTVGGVANSSRSNVEKRKSTSYFGSIFGSSSTTNTDTTNTTTTAPLPPIDPIFKVISPALASLGKQLRNVEAQSTREQENSAREWRNNVKPVLEVEIAQLEKQAAALMLQIEREANKGIAHINALEGLLKDINTEMDTKKRKYHLPDSTITLGNGGVYVGLNDFWLQQLSGHFSVCLHPKKDGSPSEITVVLTGKKHTTTNNTTHTTSTTEDGVTVQFRAEGFKLVGDKGKKVPKLSFDNLKLAVTLTLSLTLTFDHNTKKWLLPGKNFNLRILSFKGPYGINRSMVGMILSLVTPMIRTAIATAIPHEVGMLLHSLPTDFSLRGEFDLRGMDMTILSTDFHKCDTMMELSGYSPQQLEMFVLMQRAMERSTIIRNLADLITYRRKYAAHTELYNQLLLIWAECCITYCELVITAKMEQLIEQSSGSINPFSMSIKFDVFMTACDDICHKRTTAKCAIQYVDGQISLNELLQFVFQVQHRLASDELPKSSGLRKVRLTTLIESLQAQFSLARALVALVVQNFDFAHLTIVGDVRSGPFGQANIKVAELLAQMPMFLNLSIMEDKNIGALSLVPYILSFKPQENGDVCLELYSFTQDVALPETSHHTLPVTIQPKPYDKALQAEQEHQLQQALALEKDSIGQCYSTNYNKLLNAITLNRAVGNSRHHLHPMYDPVTQSILSGSHANTPTHHSNYSDSGTPRKRNSRRASCNALSTQYVPITSTSANAHLSVKHNELHKALHHTLHDYPTGEESDTICTIVATNPHISVIVDQAVKLAAGTELLTIIVGPKVKTWKPLGKATLLNDGPAHHDDHHDNNNTNNTTTTDTTNPNHTATGNTGNNILDKSGISGITDSAGISGGVNTDRPSFDFGSREELLGGTHMGCPIKVQTAPGIKMLTQVEKADVEVNLPGLIRFLLAHFRDVPLLKEYLEIFVGGVFMVEHLNIYKIIIEKIAKYLLLPGIELDINLNIRIVVKDAQILVRVETPDQVVSVQEQGGGGLDLNADNLARLANNNNIVGGVGKGTSKAGSVHGSVAGGSSKNLHLHNPTHTSTNTTHTKPHKLPNSAVNLAAEISVQDLINDIAEVMEHLKVFFEPAVSEGGRG